MSRALTVQEIVETAIVKAWRREGWFSSLLFKLKPVARADARSMSVDAGLRLRYRPEFVERWGAEFMPTFIAHEIRHPLLRHHDRYPGAAARLAPRFALVAPLMAELFHLNVTSFAHLFNIAADFEINVDLVRAGHTFPPEFGHLMPGNHDLPDDLLAEQYCEEMIARAERIKNERQQQQQGQAAADGEAPQAEARDDQAGEGDAEHPLDGDAEPAAGGGPDGAGPDGDADSEPDDGGADVAGDDLGAGPNPVDAGDDVGGGAAEPGDDRAAPGGGHCGGCAGAAEPGDDEPAGDDLPEASTDAAVDAAVRQVAAEIIEAAKQAKGSRPGGALIAWANRMLAPPKLDARKFLAAQLRGAVSSARGCVDWKMGRPSRRREVMKQWLGDEAPLLPTLAGPEPRIMVVMDTSGSMRYGQRTERALAEFWGVVRAAGVPIMGMAVDAAVQEVRRVTCVDDLRRLLRGNGGTNMPLGVREAMQYRSRPEVVVLLTDGETDWPERADIRRGATLVTVVVNETREAYRGMPDWLRRTGAWISTKEES